MAESKKITTGGIGFPGLLTILFIGLKLTKYIAWSWWWVLSPLWIPISLILGLFIFACCAFGINKVIERLNE